MSVRNQLTSEERRFISVAKVASSCEVDELIRIIERLSGEDITPADEDEEDGINPFGGDFN